jgi:hypothetical protein
MDGSGNWSKHVHLRTIQLRRNLTCQQRAGDGIHSITKALGERCQDPFLNVVECRRKVLSDDIGFGSAIKLDVVWEQTPVQREVSCGSGWRHAEPLNQVSASDVAKEVQPKFDVRQPFTLGQA